MGAERAVEVRGDSPPAQITGLHTSPHTAPGLVHPHPDGLQGALCPTWGGPGRERGYTEEGRRWGPPEDDIRGTYGDLRERTHQVSSSSFFEVPLWFEFNFDFLNFSRLKLK